MSIVDPINNNLLSKLGVSTDESLYSSHEADWRTPSWGRIYDAQGGGFTLVFFNRRERTILQGQAGTTRRRRLRLIIGLSLFLGISEHYTKHRHLGVHAT